VTFIIVLLGLTAIMAFFATKVKLSYEMVRMLPNDHPQSQEYDEFKKVFGEDGSVFAIGFCDSNMFQYDRFVALYDLTEKIRSLNGIEEVLSVTRLYKIEKDDSLKKFRLIPVLSKRPSNQQEVDSVKMALNNLKFYHGLLYVPKTNTYLLGITLDKKKINDASRTELINQIKSMVDDYGNHFKTEIHYSGLPYIRTSITEMLQHELILFILLAILVAALIMLTFFRSWQVVLTSIIVIIVTVIWALGTIALFNYKISALIGITPTLIIIIAIENCIYLINKYHWEYRIHGNKVKAQSRVITKIGFATLLTNATTATGFAAFIFTSNSMLKEFGIVTSINIMVEYILSVIITTIIFSYLPAPKPKQLEHLDKKSLNFAINGVRRIVIGYRPAVYIIGSAIVLICIYGTTKMNISGKLVDDIPQSNIINKDLRFFEKNLGGVMPFEISIDTKKVKGVFSDDAKLLYKIKKLERTITQDTVYSKLFSKPVSLVSAVSFAYQAYKGGEAKYYVLPDMFELNKMNGYLKDMSSTKNTFKSFLDSSMQKTRISIQMADVGTVKMNEILHWLKPNIDSIFNPKEYKVYVTGSSVVFTKGTEFLIGNLWESILIGVLIISLLITLVFSSFRMIMIVMEVNIIPLIITAGIMGYFNIPVKPSTIIVFSVALGISIDNAILFLTRYRYELKLKAHNITSSVDKALKEVGSSMIYSSSVLILGFGIFLFSGYGGTQALGLLIPITLLFALFFNILVLPSLILTFKKISKTKAFEKPLVEAFDEYQESSEENEDI
jgi:hypothetical protein